MDVLAGLAGDRRFSSHHVTPMTPASIRPGSRLVRMAYNTVLPPAGLRIERGQHRAKEVIYGEENHHRGFIRGLYVRVHGLCPIQFQRKSDIRGPQIHG